MRRLKGKAETRAKNQGPRNPGGQRPSRADAVSWPVVDNALHGAVNTSTAGTAGTARPVGQILRSSCPTRSTTCDHVLDLTQFQ